MESRENAAKLTAKRSQIIAQASAHKHYDREIAEGPKIGGARLLHSLDAFPGGLRLEQSLRIFWRCARRAGPTVSLWPNVLN